jgi:small multidrug resistance pump
VQAFDEPGASSEPAREPLAGYRPWFYAAAVYNLAWGLVAIFLPGWFFGLIGMAAPNYPALWQVIGMFVLVYAPAYWWVARCPSRHRHLIIIGLLGKIFGPVGVAFSAASGQLPLAFGLTLLTNDLIWWPAFALFLRDAARLSGGWLALLSGE